MSGRWPSTCSVPINPEDAGERKPGQHRVFLWQRTGRHAGGFEGGGFCLLLPTAGKQRCVLVPGCGELLKQIEPKPGARTDIEPSNGAGTRSQAARDAGLSKRQKDTALRVANVPARQLLKETNPRRAGPGRGKNKSSSTTTLSERSDNL